MGHERILPGDEQHLSLIHIFNENKNTYFPLEKREQMIRDYYRNEPRIIVQSYDCLLYTSLEEISQDARFAAGCRETGVSEQGGKCIVVLRPYPRLSAPWFRVCRA